MPIKEPVLGFIYFLAALFLFYGCSEKIVSHITELSDKRSSGNDLEDGFLNPPNSAKPGVYWYFMDGNLSKKAITADMESMKKVGLSAVVFLEVNVGGVPRGTIDFLSDAWQDLFKHAVREGERLGIEITLGTGPGWAGSGGPWVSGSQSMQHLVSSAVQVVGSGNKKIVLPLPAPKKPYFGEGIFLPDLKKKWLDFYEDVAVLAYPTPLTEIKIEGIDEKALYYRAPYTSAKNVKPFLPSLADYGSLPAGSVISKNKILYLTGRLLPDGTLNWEVPAGKWTIVRFGRRNNGAVTRPAPLPGLGFEADKFDTLAINAHLDEYTGKLLRRIGKLDKNSTGGLKMLHIDSWEMGSQNWTPRFREEFTKRRGYDPLPFFPVYAGSIVESLEISERFLWDLRLTSQELIIDYHANHIKKYSHKLGLGLSIEPYDMNPTADLELGAVADVPMCEFWSKGYGFNSAFSCIEATSIAHVNGQSLVAAEAFTANAQEGWKQYPGSMKNQGDWAFAAGVNRFYYHTFQNQALDEKLRPGMTMGPYGVHWDRGQTWWPMVGDYHSYISRCQFLLQQGRTSADILYLTPEGAPHVFRAPSSALTGDPFLPDRKGYNFDGCSPGQLYKATVKNNQVVFPGGASYRILVLPKFETMTPSLAEKIRSLVNDGALVIGDPSLKSPSLSGYPESDKKVQFIAKTLWGSTNLTSTQTNRNYGKGKLIWGGEISKKADESLYPSYELTAKILTEIGVSEDFKSSGPIRYTHRTSENWDIYFVSNTTDQGVKTEGIFRTTKGIPELWDAVTGEMRKLPEFSTASNQTSLPLQFDPYQSFFVVFRNNTSGSPIATTKNFLKKDKISTLSNPWAVSFDPIWGGPEKIKFDSLTDWTLHPEEGIKYYSGIAIYRQDFDLPKGQHWHKNSKLFLDLGEVKNMARVHLNGKDLGVIWTAPWQVDITEAVKLKGNKLEIEVANLWPNRLTGDEKLPYDGVINKRWPEWLTKGEKRTSGRYAFETYRHYTKDSPLLKSGLLGSVTIERTSLSDNKVETDFKPKRDLLKIIATVLSQSAKQYRVLIKNVPDGLFPRTYQDGQLKPIASSAWISGFYPGTLLFLYDYSKDKLLYDEAVKKLKVLEKEQFNEGTHDLGFMMYCSFGNAKKLSNTSAYDKILLNSASSLASRFNEKAGVIRSWDHAPEKWKYPVIIDNMMNLELLTWATRFSGDSTFYKIAVEHANTTLKNHFRPDYSSYHVIDYDPQTGKVRNKLTGQGYSDESAWARGQAWGLYGYVMMYRETKDIKYLDQAHHIANFILNHPNLPKDKVPYWDFNAPNIPNAPRDASAAAIISSALIELAGYSDRKVGQQYLQITEDILRSLSSENYRAKVGENGGFILKHSVGNMPVKSEVDVPLSYADYYYVEAMRRYKNLPSN